VAQNRRQHRRQGIVYGPPRGSGRYSDNGVLIGRFLGLGILLLTLGALAAGALAFVGDRPGALSTPTRSPTTAASFSFLPQTLTPTIAPSVAPTLLPTITAAVLTPAPSIPPSVAPPLVQIGEGFVTFGTMADDQLHIVDPRSSFAATERIVWSAYLTRPADAIDLAFRIVKIDSTVEGGERLILEEPVTPLVRNAQILGHRIRPDMVLEGAGVYTVRYVRGDVVLAEGSFEVAS
jgi:hypothetical protein